MQVREGDFVRIEYTGKIMDTGAVFDTTSEKLAKTGNIFNEKSFYGPIVICLGKGQLLPGLEKEIAGKETGKNYNIELTAERGFGKKDGKLLKLIATTKFLKQGIRPVPGLSVNIDGLMGTVRTVTGGRTIVDFNHPMAGQNLMYDLMIIEKLEDLGAKLDGLLKFELGTIKYDTKLEEGKLCIKVPKEFPAEIKLRLGERIKEYLPEIKDIKFE
jgi:FKBP-type peptidyl-prolyl cis-trans isomerase 2